MGQEDLYKKLRVKQISERHLEVEDFEGNSTEEERAKRNRERIAKMRENEKVNDYIFGDSYLDKLDRAAERHFKVKRKRGRPRLAKNL